LFNRRSKDENYDPNKYLGDSDDRFLFDGESGIYKPKSYYKEQKRNKFKIFSFSLFQCVTLLLSAATLLFLIKYTNYARLQWCEMRSASAAAWQSVAGIQRQTRMDERPWIRAVLPFAPLPKDIRAGEITQFHVLVRGLGKTPAKDIHGKLTAEIVREGEPVTLTYAPYIEMQSGIMFPTQDQTVNVTVYNAVADKTRDVVAESRPFTNVEVDLLRSGKAEVFIYGEFTFSDVFGTDHWYKFCASQSDRQERTLKDWDAKQSCGQYNDTDNN
jgi:hypothetical protein